VAGADLLDRRDERNNHRLRPGVWRRWLAPVAAQVV